ncbi:hypothetical protein BD324DRAFT_648394 [Kockovaella imperatae]|uniref:AhpC/TSA antioxidant enzyme-domain-containing protein n=1 Tax=Kockovaella imperatae TaxID=4999 RepID=A0A1Y1URI3_9TREE|nr:hypothetical protein BD324DRAFT_648394 [Kockovaella imperatae]ORX39765.1 hypothetical protein BD324DRAFT_648394 [Kockovaella imperatae]
MSSSRSSADLDRPPTPEQLVEAQSSELFDEDGHRTTFGELTRGKRVVVIFIRHWWCIVCQTYIKRLAAQIPPSNLPEGTSVIVIGCGGYAPIKAYKSGSSDIYPIYANPSLSLYKLFDFTAKLKPEDPDNPKEYTSDLGSSVQRVFTGLKVALKRIDHLNSHGPIAQNGGEVVLEADERCSFFHRMQNTADHTDLIHLAKAIGAEYNPPSAAEKAKEAEPMTCDGPVKA